MSVRDLLRAKNALCGTHSAKQSWSQQVFVYFLLLRHFGEETGITRTCAKIYPEKKLDRIKSIHHLNISNLMDLIILRKQFKLGVYIGKRSLNRANNMNITI